MKPYDHVIRVHLNFKIPEYGRNSKKKKMKETFCQCMLLFYSKLLDVTHSWLIFVPLSLSLSGMFFFCFRCDHFMHLNKIGNLKLFSWVHSNTYTCSSSSAKCDLSLRIKCTAEKKIMSDFAISHSFAVTRSFDSEVNKI